MIIYLLSTLDLTAFVPQKQVTWMRPFRSIQPSVSAPTTSRSIKRTGKFISFLFSCSGRFHLYINLGYFIIFLLNVWKFNLLHSYTVKVFHIYNLRFGFRLQHLQDIFCSQQTPWNDTPSLLLHSDSYKVNLVKLNMYYKFIYIN